MRFPAAALPLLLGGCLQIAVLGEPGGPASSSTGRPTSTGKATSGGSGQNGTTTGIHGTGTTTGIHGTGTTTGGTSGTGTGSGCGPCAPGATCEDSYCRCPDDTQCDKDSKLDSYCDNGTCHSCLLQGGSFNGVACTIKLATSNIFPGCIAVNSTTVFWMDGNIIYSLPIAGKNGGTSPTPLRQTAQGAQGCLTADEDRVYYTEASGNVQAMLVDGGAATPGGGPIATGQGICLGIFVDATDVYWTSSNYNWVRKATKLDGSNQVSLANLPGAFEPWGIFADSTSVYWANASHGSIMKVSIDGGAVTVLANGEQGPQQIVVQGNYVYWTTSFGSDASIKVAPLSGIPDGGAAPVLAKIPFTLPFAIAVDPEYVYWTSSAGVAKALLDGGGVPTILNPLAANRIALDPQRIYWTTGQGHPSPGVYELSPK